MAQDNTAPQSGQTATAREVALELGSFTQQLKAASDKLQTEKQNINTAKAEIKEELDDTVKTFVKTTFTSLTDGKLDDLSRTAQNVPELGAQSISFFVKKIQLNSDEALKSINASLTETIDAEGFQQRYAKAKEDSQAAATAEATARAAAGKASTDISSWQKTGDYEFIQMDKRVAEAGLPALTSDNRAFYEPKNFIQKAWWAMTKGSEYRGVRKALKDYGHGVGPKDAFADLAGFKAKDATLEAALTTANTAQQTAAETKQTANTLVRQFGQVESQIKTDDQILAAAQDKIATYFSTPAFVTAIKGQYGEDFPASVPLMIAKMATLDKLEEGVDAKIQTANANYTSAAAQYAKISRVPAYKKVNVDMDDLQKRNRARIQEYDNYATAANQSWTRTKSYAPTHTTVYVDRSPSFFELMLLNDMLNSQRSYQVNNYNNYNPNPMSSYTTDLMGVDKSQAVAQGIPAAVFDTSPEVKQQMQDIGIQDYKTNDFMFDAPGVASSNSSNSNFDGNFGGGSNDNRAADNLFDTAISDASTAPAPSYSNSDRGYSSPYREPSRNSSLFDTSTPTPSARSNDDSPSFGGGGFGGSRS